MTARTRRQVLFAAAPCVAALALAVGVARREPLRSPVAEPNSAPEAPLEPPRPRAPNEAAAAPAEGARTPPATPEPPREPDEAELMGALRSAHESDPGFVIALAREGNRRFPNSSDAPERASLLIHALAEQGLPSEARGEAEDMVNRYPDSRWVREIEQFTGAHRHRNLRLDEAGRLRYVDPPPPS